MFSKQSLSTKTAVTALVLLLIFLADIKYKQWQNQVQIEKQKNSLQAQADTLQKKNDELNLSLSYLNSDSFKERVAREQLGLKKNGETVYGFSNGQNVLGAATQITDTTPNPQKWWNYFFATE